MVRICSNKIMESLSSPLTLCTIVCVGSFFFVPICPVIAATMTVDAQLDNLDDKELSIVEATVNGLCKAKEPED